MIIWIILFAMLAELNAWAAPLPEKADLLASNTVVARYEKTHHHPCRHMTALCPDRCDHASTLAHFRVLYSENYQKTSEYGDEEMKSGCTAMVDMLRDIPGQNVAVTELISRLKPGETVRMTINHYYVQVGQNFFPVRPVVKIELLNQ